MNDLFLFLTSPTWSNIALGVRIIGYVLLISMILFSLIIVKEHRLVFLGMVLWIASLIASLYVRQIGLVEASLFITNTFTTILEQFLWIVILAKLLEYAGKISNGNGAHQ